MKTILLIGGSILLLFSCGQASDPKSIEIPSNEEVKPKVEVEETVVVIDSAETFVLQAIEPEQHRETPRQWGDMDRNPGSDTGKELIVLEKPYPELPTIPFDSSKYMFHDPDFDARIDPLFPGGAKEMKKFIQANIQYPSRDCVEGRVYVSFVVEKDGCVTNVEVMRGISEDFDNEALRLVRSMPKWIPAQNSGKVVAAKVRLPISFTLN